MYGVRISAPGFDPGDDAFSVEPGGAGRSPCAARIPTPATQAAVVTALNLEDPVRAT